MAVTAIGPVAAARAYVPPGTAQHSPVATLTCAGLSPACPTPLVEELQVLGGGAKAVIEGTETAQCDNMPTDFASGALLGGNGCISVAHAKVTPAGVVANGVAVQSQVQGCESYDGAVAHVAIGDVTVNDTVVKPPDSAPPAPNTHVPAGPYTVILNEQHYDNEGHGFTVNAVHVFTTATAGPAESVDVVIGHAHSELFCDAGTVTTPPDNPSATGQKLPIGTKDGSPATVAAGDTVTYTITVDPQGCLVTRVTDVLPPGFTYVDGTASGDLGAAPAAATAINGQQTLRFFNGAGFALPAEATVLTETFDVLVPADATPGQYVNDVDGTSTPAAADTSATCGEFAFSDTGTAVGAVAEKEETTTTTTSSTTTTTEAPTTTTTVAPGSGVLGAREPEPAAELPETGLGSAWAWGQRFALLAIGLGLAGRRRLQRPMGAG
jgi:uncharacterized repeat protein (TIGR01451 family)